MASFKSIPTGAMDPRGQYVCLLYDYLGGDDFIIGFSLCDFSLKKHGLLLWNHAGS